MSIQHGLRKARCYRARHVITVIVSAFLTADKMQSTINEIKHGNGCAQRAIMVPL